MYQRATGLGQAEEPLDDSYRSSSWGTCHVPEVLPRMRPYCVPLAVSSMPQSTALVVGRLSNLETLHRSVARPSCGGIAPEAVAGGFAGTSTHSAPRI
jgi:hypothetical protein